LKQLGSGANGSAVDICVCPHHEHHVQVHALDERNNFSVCSKGCRNPQIGHHSHHLVS